MGAWTSACKSSGGKTCRVGIVIESEEVHARGSDELHLCTALSATLGSLLYDV